MPRNERNKIIQVLDRWRPAHVSLVALKTPEDNAAKAAAEEPVDARNFILRAINDGQASEQAALYVASKTTNNDVRSYAALMGQEQGKDNEQLRRIAAKRGIETPNDPESATRQQLDQLREMGKGAQLDQAFLQQFGIDAQASAIALFERQAGQGEDKELKQYAAQVLPKLRSYYRQAKALQKNTMQTSKLSM